MDTTQQMLKISDILLNEIVFGFGQISAFVLNVNEAEFAGTEYL